MQKAVSLTCVIWSHINVEQVFLHLATEAPAWVSANPPPSAVPTSDHLTNWRLWGGWNVFCPVWCDCLQRNGLTLPPNATHTRTHSLWPSWRCVRQTCWVQEVWDPVTTSSRQRTEDPVSWNQDGTIMSRPATTTTSFQVLLKPSPLTFPLHAPSNWGIRPFEEL